MDNLPSLADTVRRRRLELGFTQEQLAERISAEGVYVRQSEISRIERGQVMLPRRERLERLAHALDMSVGELLEASGWTGAAERFDAVPPLASRGAKQAHAMSPAARMAIQREGVTPVAAPPTERARVIRDQRIALQHALDTLRDERERLSQNIAVSRQLWPPGYDHEEPAGGPG